MKKRERRSGIFMIENKKEIGNAGEERAARFYEERGFEIVARNFRTKRGEIDIIVAKDDLIVFAEVKTLPGGEADTLAYELNATKRRKIIESAKFFLEKHRKYSNSIVRFDAVVVDMPGLAPVYLIENAFSEN